MPDRFEADSIRKTFWDKQVLTDVYLSCITGDIIGLLGRNGTGKSTLLRILFGTLYTDYKHLSFNGQILDKPYKTSGVVSFLPQENFLPGNITVKQAIQYYGCRIDDPEYSDDQVLSKIWDTRIRNISGGELRYLEIKLVLGVDSKFTLLDEPFNGISPVQIDLIKEMLLKTKERKGIVLTDHDYRNVLDVSNIYMILFDGGIKKLKSKDDFIYWGYLPEK